jgi:hypothetical protein
VGKRFLSSFIRLGDFPASGSFDLDLDLDLSLGPSGLVYIISTLSTTVEPPSSPLWLAKEMYYNFILAHL